MTTETSKELFQRIAKGSALELVDEIIGSSIMRSRLTFFTARCGERLYVFPKLEILSIIREEILMTDVISLILILIVLRYVRVKSVPLIYFLINFMSS